MTGHRIDFAQPPFAESVGWPGSTTNPSVEKRSDTGRPRPPLIDKGAT